MYKVKFLRNHFLAVKDSVLDISDWRTGLLLRDNTIKIIMFLGSYHNSKWAVQQQIINCKERIKKEEQKLQELKTAIESAAIS